MDDEEDERKAVAVTLIRTKQKKIEVLRVLLCQTNSSPNHCSFSVSCFDSSIYLALVKIFCSS